MTEELEKKLTELLELKKQFEQVNEGRRKEIVSSLANQWKKEARNSRIRFWVGVVMGLVFIELGVISICSTELKVMNVDVPDRVRFFFGAMGVVFGIVVPSAAKLGLHLTQTRLSILHEMKQFELRMMELLKK